MKKLFTLFAVAAMAFAAQANELTVCDNGVVGEDAWGSIPVYGYWFDTEGMTQQIYPAEMLTDMAGGQITSLTFYTAATWGAGYENYAIAFDGAEILLSLKEVEQDAFADEDPMIGGATVVAVAEAVAGGLYLTFELEEPFEYNGGNLLVECYWDGEGSWGSTYFLGEETDRNTAYYGIDYYGEWSEYAFNVLNKVTFTYEAGEVGPVDPEEKTDAPSSQKENYVYNDGNIYYNAYTVTLIETEPSDIYYRIGIMGEDGQYTYGDWQLYTGPFNVEEEGTYMVEAYAVAEGKAESDHIYDGFVVSKAVSVDELFAGKTVSNVRYFNVAGQEMQQANGLTIVVTTYTDGTQSAVKVVK